MQNLSCENIAKNLYQKLKTRNPVFGELSVEVSKNANGIDIIVSVNENQELLDRKEEILDVLSKIKNSTIYFPRPEMGYDFIFGNKEDGLNPEHLFFHPLKNKNKPHEIGIQIVSDKYNDLEKEVIKKIIQIGSGDILSLKIAYLEVKRGLQSDTDRFLSIKDLSSYIRWRTNHNKSENI